MTRAAIPYSGWRPSSIWQCRSLSGRRRLAHFAEQGHAGWPGFRCTHWPVQVLTRPAEARPCSSITTAPSYSHLLTSTPVPGLGDEVTPIEVRFPAHAVTAVADCRQAVQAMLEEATPPVADRVRTHRSRRDASAPGCPSAHSGTIHEPLRPCLGRRATAQPSSPATLRYQSATTAGSSDQLGRMCRRQKQGVSPPNVVLTKHG